PRARVEHVDRSAGIPAWKRAAGDDDPAVGRGRGRVTDWSGQAGNDACARARTPGHDRVQPARTRVAADDVRLAVENGGRVVAARCRQRPYPDRRARHGIDPEDLVQLADAVAAAELVDGRADPGCGAVVENEGQPADRPRAAAVDRADVRGR